MKGVKDWTIACLKAARMRCQEGQGGGRKETTLRERVKGVKDWVVGRSRESKMEHVREEARGRKSTTLRVIELTLVPALPRPPRPGHDGQPRFHLGSVKVEEHEVLGVDSSSP